jgi:phosphoglycolate phosphatase-like HAD superfamily hydrolase
VIDRLDFKFPRLHIAAARELPVVRNGRFLRRNMAREQVGRGVDERAVEVEGDRVHAFHERVPYLLLTACAGLGIAPRELLFLGDSSLDAAARAAGCPVVLVDYRYNRGRPACDAGADAVIASLLELAA